MNGISPDRVVAVIGTVMAMMIVSSAARSRGITLQSGLKMGMIWVVIFLAVAAVFATFGR